MRIIKVTDCQDCPFYDRLEGRREIYHTCHHSNKTVKNDFSILFRFCELEELDD